MRFLKKGVTWTGLHRRIGRRRRFIVVLRFHSLFEGEPNPLLAGISVSVQAFRTQVKELARWLKPMSMDDVAHALANAEAFTESGFAITFDDGYADNALLAGPALSAAGIPGTFYLQAGDIEHRHLPWFCRLRRAFRDTTATRWVSPLAGGHNSLWTQDDRERARRQMNAVCAASVGREQIALVEEVERRLEIGRASPAESLMMTWDQAAALLHAGHGIGSHTLSHPDLTMIASDAARLEIVGAGDLIHSRLGVHPAHFAYPNPVRGPHTSTDLQAMLHEIGYRTAVTSVSGLVKSDTRRLCIPRLPAANDVPDFNWQMLKLINRGASDAW